MSNYQKATEWSMEIYLDPQFSKKEPKKVWLTVEQVDEIQTLLAFLAREGKRQFIRQTAIDYERFLQKLVYQAKKRIAEAEGKE